MEGATMADGVELSEDDALRRVLERTSEMSKQRALFGAKGLSRVAVCSHLNVEDRWVLQTLKGCTGRFINLCRIPTEPFLCSFTDNEKCLKVAPFAPNPPPPATHTYTTCPSPSQPDS